MSDEKSVTIECGTVDASYRGVVDPQLEAVYVQSPKEEAKYAPIMKELLENGLPTEGEKISGI